MISLEIAKELKKVSEEKGVELPKSLWSYDRFTSSFNYTLWLTSTDKSEIPAYNLEELLDILSKNPSYTINVESWYEEGKLSWIAWHITGIEDTYKEANTPADAAGELLIELIKRGNL